MSLADVVRSGIATAHKLTTPLQPLVTIKQWIGQSQGTDAFATPFQVHAIVDRSQRIVYAAEGRTLVVVCTVLVLTPLPPATANSPFERTNPVDPKDVVTLDDGFTAPIVKVGGFEDAGLAVPFYNEIMLGSVRG